MATTKTTPKKKAVAKNKIDPKPQSEFQVLRTEMEGLGERLDIMIQQLDAIRQLITPPKDKAKEKR